MSLFTLDTEHHLHRVQHRRLMVVRARQVAMFVHVTAPRWTQSTRNVIQLGTALGTKWRSFVHVSPVAQGSHPSLLHERHDIVVCPVRGVIPVFQAAHVGAVPNFLRVTQLVQQLLFRLEPVTGIRVAFPKRPHEAPSNGMFRCWGDQVATLALGFGALRPPRMVSEQFLQGSVHGSLVSKRPGQQRAEPGLSWG